MSSLVLYPALSSDGWISDNIKVIDYLLSCFFVAEYSQSYTFINKISSLPYIIQSNKGNVEATMRDLENVLRLYFSRYYSDVVTEVTNVTSDTDPSRIELSIYLSFTDSKGNQYVLSKLLRTMNGKILEIIDTNNG